MKLLRPFMFIACCLSLFLLSSPMQSHAQQFEHGGEYLSYLFSDHPEYQDKLWNYIKTAAHSKNARKIEKRRKEVIDAALEVKKKASRRVPYEGDASLRDALTHYFDLTHKILQEDYAKIINMEAIAEESYDAMEAYILAKEKANDKLDEAGEELEQVQQAFASAHNIQLIDEENEKGRKIEEASAVYHYYNQLYLIFFKSYKQEAYLLAALENSDVNALIQNQNSLKSYSQEGLTTLETFPLYNEDGSIIASAKEMLSFYQKEAAEKGSVLANFYLQQDNMQKVQQAFDAIKPSKRTQGDVDTFNQAVNDFNQAVNDFNQTIEQLNAERSALLAKWNQTTEQFIDTHVP